MQARKRPVFRASFASSLLSLLYLLACDDMIIAKAVRGLALWPYSSPLFCAKENTHGARVVASVCGSTMYCTVPPYYPWTDGPHRPRHLHGRTAHTVRCGNTLDFSFQCRTVNSVAVHHYSGAGLVIYMRHTCTCGVAPAPTTAVYMCALCGPVHSRVVSALHPPAHHRPLAVQTGFGFRAGVGSSHVS